MVFFTEKPFLCGNTGLSYSGKEHALNGFQKMALKRYLVLRGSRKRTDKMRNKELKNLHSPNINRYCQGVEIKENDMPGCAGRIAAAQNACRGLVRLNI